MKPRLIRMIQLLPGIALLVSACSLVSARPPQPALHDFGPVPVVSNSAASAITMDAPAWLRDERIRYRMLHNDPTQVRFYALDTWLAPPPALLAQQLSTAINSAKYRLFLTLTDFEQVFDQPDRAHIVLSFRAQAEPLNGKPSAQHLFQYTRPCPSPDAKGAVSAYALSVTEAVTDLRAWLMDVYKAD